mmetsp:Transcript_17838/g.48513  ORF Transcript_17838/g.48513 Transcript_17838/m.48513 type:complete len:842 (+) Transcript_17838:153-2678(+)
MRRGLYHQRRQSLYHQRQRSMLATSAALVLVACSAFRGTGAHQDTQPQCGLYMAASFLEGAGYGLFLGHDLPEGAAIGGGDYSDVFIPIQDKFKTLPYRGQQLFLSWLGYVWPAKADHFYPTYSAEVFPEIPLARYGVDAGLNGVAKRSLKYTDGKGTLVSAFAPGVSSLVNSGPARVNIQKKSDVERVDNNATDNGRGYSPHFGVTFETTRALDAGTELFMDYGATWHDRHNYLRNMGTEYRKQNKNGVEKTASVDESQKRVADLVHKRDSQEILKAMQDAQPPEQDNQQPPVQTPAIDEEEDEDEFLHVTENKQLVEEVDWLEENAYCVDNLRWNPSTLPDAGRGAFAKRFLKEGDIIAPAPLLTVKRGDLDIFEAKKVDGNYRHYLDMDRKIGEELLLNYAFGHKDSNLLLVPYSPVVNFINHNGREANAYIRWPDPGHPAAMRDPQEWLERDPLDVLNESGSVMMEIVALRDLKPGEEIFLDYGPAWEEAWQKHASGERDGGFRHEIGVPNDFYPQKWINTSDLYELEPLDAKPGEVVRLKWKHNGKPVSESAHAVGLPKGFTAKMKEYTDGLGITDMYRTLLLTDEPYLEDNQWFLFNDTSPKTQEWFVYGYKQRQWAFNMHYIAAYNERARQSLLAAMGDAGFDVALDAMGKFLGLDHLTCFHASYMGASKCENSVVHSDVFDTDGKSVNVIFPVLLVDGSKPELDIIGSDANVILPVKYMDDVAYFLTDEGGYHKTSPHRYDGADEVRVMVGSYCSQIEETNWQRVKHLYDMEVVPPFMHQFDLPLKEVHWSSQGGHSLRHLQQGSRHHGGQDEMYCEPQAGEVPETTSASIIS